MIGSVTQRTLSHCPTAYGTRSATTAQPRVCPASGSSTGRTSGGPPLDVRAATYGRVLAKISNALQESYVAQGLALGVLADGIEWLPAGKLDFEFAVSSAWHRFSHAARFPRVGSKVVADPYYAILYRSASRRGPLMAAWDVSGPGVVPYVWNDGWSIEESGEMLADWTEVPWPAWQQLGHGLITYYRDRGKV